MIINTFIQDILYLIIAITTIMSFISIVAFVGNYRKERKNGKQNIFSYILSIILLVVFFPYIFLIIETAGLDQNNYLFSSLNLYSEFKFLFVLLLIDLLFMVPLFISYITSKKLLKKILPIVLAISLIFFYINILKISINSYIDFENNNMMLNTNVKYIINSDANIYCSAENPKIMYPLFSPLKLSIGKFDEGENVYLLSDKNALKNFDYVKVTNGKQTGYIETKYISFK